MDNHFVAAVVFLVGGSFFLGIALDFKGMNDRMADARSSWFKKSPAEREAMHESQYDINRVCGWIGAIIGYTGGAAFMVDAISTLLRR